MDNNQTTTQSFRPNFKTDRNMWICILLNLVTCGIYGIYFFTKLANDVNTISTKRDGQKTMHYCLMLFVFSWLTCGIYPLIWFHKISARIGDEARARGIQTDFGASTYWLWNVLGSIILVGPFIYLYQLCKTMNAICENYNTMGY